VASRQHLRSVLHHAGFPRLYAVRLGGQFGDGVFQAALAGAVLFSPEHSASAADIASGFAVLLLPYSLVGPFAGVLLDRWWRQRVLVFANIARSLAVLGVAAELALGGHGQPLYASALVVVSFNRFILSALSASLPHVVSEQVLVTANAFSTTSGSVATTAGAGLAIGLRTPFGDSGGGYALAALAAAVAYLLSSWWARSFERTVLGPDNDERVERETVGEILRGLVAGAQHVYDHKPALYSLATITILRFSYGMTTVCTLLLYRNYFHSQGVLRSGLPGLAQVTVVLAIGAGAAALVTPAASRRLSLAGWPTILMASASIIMLTLWLPYRLALVLPGAFAMAFVSQGVKICVDTVVQRTISDAYRGRVFTSYDTLFNVAFVAAAVITALLLPETGHAPASIVVLAGLYALAAGGYWWGSRRVSDPVDRAAYQALSSPSARSAPSGP
jgi:LPXTG-motif cell wall-anchored protein